MPNVTNSCHGDCNPFSLGSLCLSVMFLIHLNFAKTVFSTDVTVTHLDIPVAFARVAPYWRWTISYCSLFLFAATCVWTLFVNTNVANGVARRETTLDACQLACVNTPLCIGIDTDYNTLANFCWLTVLPAASGPLTSFANVNHYTLTRTTGCPFAGWLFFVQSFDQFLRQRRV